METSHSSNRTELWARSRREIGAGREMLRVGRLDDAIACFRSAHDLGVDSIRLHSAAHSWLAIASARKRDWREAALNAMFAAFSAVVTPWRNLRGRRPQAFTPT